MSMPDVIDRVLAAARPVGAFEVEDDWIDVGQREQLRARAGGRRDDVAARASRSWSPAPTASSAATSSSGWSREGADVRAFCLYNSRGSAGWLDEAPARRPRRRSTSGSATSATRGSSRRATEGVEVVFHLAALIAIPYSYVAPSSFVDTNVARHAQRARGRPAAPASRRLIHTSTQRGLRHARDAADPRDPPAPGPVAVRGHQGRGRPARPGVPPQLRPAGRRPAAVQHLRPAPVRAGGAADDAPPAAGRADARSASGGSTRGATSRSSPTRSTASCGPPTAAGIDGRTIQLGTGRAESIGELFELACGA